MALSLRRPDFTKQPDALQRFIVEVPVRRCDKVSSLVEANHGQIHQEIKIIPSLTIELPYSSLEELARSRFVKKIWVDSLVYVLLDVAVPTVGGLMTQELGYTGKGAVVAVLDTGIYPHRDLTTPDNRITAWYDLINQKSTPYDDNGHGTHVAGVIAGNGSASNSKYKGMAPEALLVGVKVLDQDGAGSISKVIAGIEWCLDNLSTHKIKVINLSMGSTAQESYRFDLLCRATTIAWNKGVVVCTAAGNEGPGSKTIDSPGINPRIITVGNMDDRQTLAVDDDRIHPSSSRGPTIDNFTKPDLIAPGTDITSLKANGGYLSMTGTSMSTPVVSGAVAQIFQKWPNLRPEQIKSLLTKNARSLGLERNFQGAGVLDLAKIFKSALPKGRSQNNNLQQILTYHFFKVLMEKTGQSVDLVKKKRDELIQKTLVNTLVNYFIHAN